MDSALTAKKCCVPNCKSTRTDDISLHSFPNPDKDPERFNQWIFTIGGDIVGDKNDVIYKSRRVCTLHFEKKYQGTSRKLVPTAVPTLNLPGTFLPKVFSKEIFSLTNKVKKLTETKLTLTNKLKKISKLSENPSFINATKKFTTMALLFTLLQFREIKKEKMGRRYTNEEKVMALSIYKQGPKAYRWLRKIFVLPAPLTLSRMISIARIRPGINESMLFSHLKKQARKMNDMDKLCILMFDEMSLARNFQYNRKFDYISGFVTNGTEVKNKIADHALVFMIRGIYRNYKQPISYSFCSGSTSKDELVSQIRNIVCKLQSTGFKVLATVCDQGASNVSAVNQLINEKREKHLRNGEELREEVFEINGEEIVALYDPPHLLKGIRNNLINKRLSFKIGNIQKTANWDHIVTLYKRDPSYQGLRLMPKLTDRHVIPNKISKMKVKCASQVFSRCVGVNMGFLAG